MFDLFAGVSGIDWFCCLLQGTLRASSKLHDLLFSKILRCPMKFFDTTPTARILNRFSKDMDEGKGQDSPAVPAI